MMTSPIKLLIWSALSLERSSTALTTAAPSSVAGILASVPPNLPTAVRAAETITMSSMMFFLFE